MRGVLEFLKEFLAFVRYTNKWWLIPFVIFFFLLGLLFLLSQGAVMAPFVYTLF